MITKFLTPTRSYMMDLETGISLPRDEAVARADANPHSLEAVRCRAYSLWEREGRPGNRNLSNWLEAESELKPNAPLPVKAMPTERVVPSSGPKPRSGEPAPSSNRQHTAARPRR